MEEVEGNGHAGGPAPRCWDGRRVRVSAAIKLLFVYLGGSSSALLNGAKAAAETCDLFIDAPPLPGCKIVLEDLAKYSESNIYCKLCCSRSTVKDFRFFIFIII